MEHTQAAEDLQTIKTFLEEGKARLTDSGQFFIYWGIAMPLTTAVFYLLLHFLTPGMWTAWFWPLTMCIHSFMMFVMGSQKKSHEKSRNFLTKINNYLWIGLLATFAVIMTIFYLSQKSVNPSMVSIIAVLLGFAYWVHGSMLQLNWLRYQAIIWWAAALLISTMGWPGASITMTVTTFICSFGTGMILHIKEKSSSGKK